jgi:hypothetical protein
VRASHLIEESTTLLISVLRAEKVKVRQLEDETLDVTGENLSTHPRLVSQSPRIRIHSSKETIDVDISAGGMSSGQTTSTNQMAVLYRGLPVDKVADQLAFGGTRPIQGGTIDLDGDGLWKTAGGVYVDLPLVITLKNTTIAVAGGQSTEVKELVIPVQVRGSLDNPQIIVNNEQLTKALAKAGVSAVTKKVRDEVEKKVGDEIKDKLGDKSQGLLKGIFGGDSEKEEENEE